MKFFLVRWPFSLSLPRPLRLGTQRLPLGGGARTVAGFPTAGGQGPATLTRLLRAQCRPSCQARDRRGARPAPPRGKECCSPFQVSELPAHLPPKVLQTRTSFSPLKFRAGDCPQSFFQASFMYQEGERGQCKQVASRRHQGGGIALCVQRGGGPDTKTRQRQIGRAHV